MKKKYRNIANKERRKAVRAYWHKTSEELRDKPCEFYKTFKPFLSDKVKGSPTICLRTNEGTVKTNQFEVAELLADYFNTAALSIGGDHVNDLTERDHDNHNSVKIIRETYDTYPVLCFEFRKLSQEEVLFTLEHLNSKKSSGWNPGITPDLLKRVARGVFSFLTSLYNDCIHECKWPTPWKMGEWTPVYKHGDKQEDKNYRPITSLIAVDKVFEQLLCNQVTKKFDPILHPRMTAYRKTHSCETTLVRLVEDWKKAIDQRELVWVLSTDMSKAFDSLSHTLILKKFEAYGFGTSSLNLMRSFLEDRMNRVKVGKVKTEWKSMKRGCPQGSSVGPMIWNIFQNDMAQQVRNSNLTMYADDHQMYKIGPNLVTVKDSLEEHGKQAMSWYDENYLQANPDKFQTFTINPRNVSSNQQNQDIVLNGKVVKNNDQIELFGVKVDDGLNFSNHISELCKKASRKVGVLTRLRNLIPCSAKLTIYKTSILPYLTYCHIVWHFCKASDRRKIECVQERALRAVFRTKTCSYETLLTMAQLPSLYNRRLQDIAIYMYKVRNGLAPNIFNEIFSIKQSPYALRNSDFNLPRFNTTRYGKHSLRYFGPRLWSKLNDSIKNLPSLISFKKAVRKLDIESLLDNNSNCCEMCRE